MAESSSKKEAADEGQPRYKVRQSWLSVANGGKGPLHKPGTVIGIEDIGTPQGQEDEAYLAELLMIGVLQPANGAARERIAKQASASGFTNAHAATQRPQAAIEAAQVAQAPAVEQEAAQSVPEDGPADEAQE